MRTQAGVQRSCSLPLQQSAVWHNLPLRPAVRASAGCSAAERSGPWPKARQWRPYPSVEDASGERAELLQLVRPPLCTVPASRLRTPRCIFSSNVTTRALSLHRLEAASNAAAATAVARQAAKPQVAATATSHCSLRAAERRQGAVAAGRAADVR